MNLLVLNRVVNDSTRYLMPFILLFVIGTVLVGCKEPSDTDVQSIDCQNDELGQAYHQQISDVQVLGCGTVVAVLADDNKGSRHQRFIVELTQDNTKHTVLIAHNIDLAPKIPKLAQDDAVFFYGEYEYNPKGGVVHWTHHDPEGTHPDGWIKHSNVIYQ